jgi:hypothetical protein
MNINTWNIKELYYYDELINFINDNNSHDKYILTTNTNYDDMNILEKYVYEISKFHIDQLDDNDKNNIFIEFYVEDKIKTAKFKINYDEQQSKKINNYVYPFVSTITYLNDNMSPSIFTSVSNNEYKYKKFENINSGIILSFPIKGKHVSYNGGKYYGCINILENDDKINIDRYCLYINLWKDHVSKYSDKYFINNTNNDLNLIFNNCSDIIIKNIEINHSENNTDETEIDENICKLDYDFYESLLYFNAPDIGRKFKSLNFSEGNTYHILNNIKKNTDELILKNKYYFINNDINNINNYTDLNRFIQRFIFKQHYSKETCKWMKTLIDLYIKNNDILMIDNMNRAFIQIDKIPNIYSYIVIDLENIMKKIVNSYSLPENENIQINLSGIGILKYDTTDNNTQLYKDDSHLTIHLLLSDYKNDFEGGNLYFEDGITYDLNQGDMLLYSSKIKYTNLPITKGTKYAVVFNLNLKA